MNEVGPAAVGADAGTGGQTGAQGDGHHLQGVRHPAGVHWGLLGRHPALRAWPGGRSQGRVQHCTDINIIC